jgi:NUC173 domain
MRAAAASAQAESPNLAFFQSTVLSLARSCDRLAGKDDKNKVYLQARVVDLWSLLPCFCQSPSDVSKSLSNLTPIVVRAISDQRYPSLLVSDTVPVQL